MALSPNLSAFLAVIRACEGTAGPNGYRTLFGGTLFNSYDDHPRVVVHASGYSSTAAGAYQILAGSWDDYRAKTGAGKSFTPDAQDAYAIWAIRDKRKALDDVEAGRLDEAIAKCAKEWASLPGSPYGQPTRSLDYCRRVYRDAGGLPDTVGVVKDQPETVTRQATQVKEDYSTGLTSNNVRKAMDPLSLISMLTGVFAPVIRAKIDKAVGSDVGGPLTENLLNLARTATGRTDPLEAVAVARQDPAVVAKLEKAAEDWLAQVAPMLEKLAQYDKDVWAAENEGKKTVSGIAIAERQAGLWDMTQTVVWFAAITLTVLVFALLGALITQAVTGDRRLDSGLLGLSGPIFMAAVSAWAAIIAFRFDGTKDSSAQNAAMAAIASRTEPRR